jgi:hypothetical protein
VALACLSGMCGGTWAWQPIRRTSSCSSSSRIQHCQGQLLSQTHNQASSTNSSQKLPVRCRIHSGGTQEEAHMKHRMNPTNTTTHLAGSSLACRSGSRCSTNSCSAAAAVASPVVAATARPAVMRLFPPLLAAVISTPIMLPPLLLTALTLSPPPLRADSPQLPQQSAAGQLPPLLVSAITRVTRHSCRSCTMMLMHGEHGCAALWTRFCCRSFLGYMVVTAAHGCTLFV